MPRTLIERRFTGEYDPTTGEPVYAPPPPKACEKCGKEFQPKRFRAKFCSNDCRNAYHKKARMLENTLATCDTLEAKEKLLETMKRMGYGAGSSRGPSSG